MGKLVLIATLLFVLGAFAMGQQSAAMTGTAQLLNQNSYDQIRAAQLEQYIGARSKAAPCPCEASEAYFTRIVSGAEVRSAGADLYSQILARQVAQYRSIRAVLAPPNDPDARLATIHELQPGSMASNSDAQSAVQDPYSLTVASQAEMNRLVAAANRP